MAMSRKEAWLTAIGVALGVLFAAGLGIYSFLNAIDAAAPEPAGRAVGQRMRPPSPEWAAAVEQGRQLARASLVEQNLPGLSVAVGVGGDIVWAEGFGWADIEKRVPVAPGIALQDRARVQGAHLGRGRPAAGERPAAPRRRDSDVRAGVPRGSSGPSRCAS